MFAWERVRGLHVWFLLSFVRPGTAGGYQLQAILPGVRPADRRAQVAADGRAIEILGVRQAPRTGSRRDGDVCEGELYSRGTFPIPSRHPSFYKTTQNPWETAGF